MQLAISTTVLSGTTVVTVAGDLDLLTAGELKLHVESMALARRQVLVVDLSGVTFLDSSGLSSLVTIRRALMQVQHGLGLVVSDRTRQLLRLTNMDDVFALYPSVGRAVGDLARAS